MQLAHVLHIRHCIVDKGSRLGWTLFGVRNIEETMQISDQQVKLVQEQILQKKMLVKEIMEIGQVKDQESEAQLVKEVTHSVLQMPDREDRIAELKAKIDAGQYNPSAEEIVDAMIRRSIADKMA